MRWLGMLVVLLAASSASAAPTSNPSFLGIEMSDMGGACVVQNVTNCSPAQDAGLRFGDLIIAIDGKSLAATQQSACDVLRARIMAHAPGDLTTYDVRRGSEAVTIKAMLSTRADVTHRCLVDLPLPSIEVVDVDDRRTYELEELRGKTTIIGFFRLSYCNGCSAVFDRVSDRIAKELEAGNINMIGVSPYDESSGRIATRKAVGFSSTVSLAVTFEDQFDDVMLKEKDRVQFMVVDSRGIIRFVAPIAPDSEDLEAAVDEVLAAARQAEHARTQRR